MSAEIPKHKESGSDLEAKSFRDNRPERWF
jgi:hypothetical protein